MTTTFIALLTAAFLVFTFTRPEVHAGFTKDVGNKFTFKYNDVHGLFLKSSHSWSDLRIKTFKSQLGVGLSAEMLSEMRFESTSGSGFKLHFGDSTTLEIERLSAECSSVTWNSEELPEIMDCIDYGSAQWFGSLESKEQLWPVQKSVKINYPVVTSDEDSAAIVERFWLTSEGIYIYIEPYVPLFINANATGDNKLCFVAKFEEPFKAVPELRLHYQVCSLPTANQAHMHALTSVLNGRPSDLPDERMVRHPIWSTWARYKRDINESVVLNFAQEILDHRFNNSQLEIDDDWETCYGELTFDSNKFPNPGAMSRRLKELGFRVTLWIHPFINERCPSFNAFKEAGYLVSDGNGNTRTSWWNGAYAGIIDFSNPDTLNWFLGRLREIKTISEVDSFKFDAGEAGWMPKPRELTGDLDLQPNSYTVSYIRALQEFGSLTEIRTGFQTQDLPLFVRMIDKDSHWGLNNGVKSIVTTLLVMSNAGYPYILPDMIGGNSYGIDILTDELFVRWLQASTFMPSLQFSYVPWSFNNPQIEEICRKFVNLHAEYTPVIMEAASLSVSTGKPINTPVWSVDFTGDDQVAFTIDDEFMLANQILVAPVLEEGATTRDIYLPPGQWRDMNTGDLITGRIWLRNYSAPLDVLPYFKLEMSNTFRRRTYNSAAVHHVSATLLVIVFSFVIGLFI